MDEGLRNYILLTNKEVDEICHSIKKRHPKRFGTFELSKVLENEYNIAWSIGPMGYISFVRELEVKIYGEDTLRNRLKQYLIRIGIKKENVKDAAEVS